MPAQVIVHNTQKMHVLIRSHIINMLTLYEMHIDGLLIWQLEFYFLKTEKNNCGNFDEYSIRCFHLSLLSL